MKQIKATVNWGHEVEVTIVSFIYSDEDKKVHAIFVTPDGHLHEHPIFWMHNVREVEIDTRTDTGTE